MLTSASKLNFMYIFVIYERCVVSLHNYDGHISSCLVKSCMLALLSWHPNDFKAATRSKCQLFELFEYKQIVVGLLTNY